MGEVIVGAVCFGLLGIIILVIEILIPKFQKRYEDSLPPKVDWYADEDE